MHLKNCFLVFCTCSNTFHNSYPEYQRWQYYMWEKSHIIDQNGRFHAEVPSTGLITASQVQDHLDKLKNNKYTYTWNVSQCSHFWYFSSKIKRKQKHRRGSIRKAGSMLALNVVPRILLTKVRSCVKENSWIRPNKIIK